MLTTMFFQRHISKIPDPRIAKVTPLVSFHHLLLAVFAFAYLVDDLYPFTSTMPVPRSRG
jgi:hypothetical protein